MSQFPEPMSNDPFAQPTEQSKGMAIGSLITGILGFIPPLGIVAIILGIIAARRAKADPTRYGGGGMAIGGIVAGSVTTLGVCVIGGLIAILLPALGQARQAARHVVAQSNLRQVGVAIHMYANANKDALPPQDWQSVLVPTYTSGTMFVRLGSDGSQEAFTYVPKFKRIIDAPDPAGTVLAYENPPYNRGKVSVLYLDGSVRTISEGELTAQLAANGEGSVRPAGKRSGP